VGCWFSSFQSLLHIVKDVGMRNEASPESVRPVIRPIKINIEDQSFAAHDCLWDVSIISCAPLLHLHDNIR
jgi:hypothetical protein